MGGHYYVSPDQEDGGSWSFSADQLTQTAIALWPGSEAAGPFPPKDATDLDIHTGDGRCRLTFYPEGPALVFPDQDPLLIPAQVILGLLNALAPGTPTVWWTDADATPEDLDLTCDATVLAEDFGS
ncbi:hypothetical protein [Streptomyces decoyicus]|uniref:hypothetical protein n=1 Tax=Streptomyces decoyicus TaxID=249567 RepID=UPI002E18CCB0|nr:hypothetical protein OG532_37040 [Streptomyces decoyicus]